MTINLENIDGVDLRATSGNGEVSVYIPKPNGGWQSGEDFAVDQYGGLIMDKWDALINQGKRPKFFGHELTDNGFVDATIYLQGTSAYAPERYKQLGRWLYLNKDGIRKVIEPTAFEQLVLNILDKLSD